MLGVIGVGVGDGRRVLGRWRLVCFIFCFCSFFCDAAGGGHLSHLVNYEIDVSTIYFSIFFFQTNKTK